MDRTTKPEIQAVWEAALGGETAGDRHGTYLGIRLQQMLTTLSKFSRWAGHLDPAAQ